MHPIETIMTPILENIKSMIDVDTIIGNPVQNGQDTVIVPISTVSFGFVAGGGEYSSGKNVLLPEPNRFPFSGGTGVGVSLKPSAVLVIKGDQVQMLPAQMDSAVDRIVEAVPRLVNEAEKLISSLKAPSGNGESMKADPPAPPPTSDD